MIIWQDKKVVDHSKLLSDSFFRWTKKHLIDNAGSDVELSEKMYQAPFVIVSHGIEADPIFNYSNLTAQKLWDFPWKEFTTLPSRLSAEPMVAEDREKFLQRAQEHGFMDGYSGIRISRNGKRFRIENTILWNVVDPTGLYLGQAAMFREWTYL